MGPVGLGALKVVKDAPQFKEGKWKVTAYEAREKIGGIWYLFLFLFIIIVRTDMICPGYPRLQKATLR